jgi:hypothetical protein
VDLLAEGLGETKLSPESWVRTATGQGPCYVSADVAKEQSK